MKKTKISKIEDDHAAARLHIGTEDSDQDDDEEEDKVAELDGGDEDYLDDEEVGYDSDEDTSSLMQTKCSLTKEKLKDFKLIGKLGKGAFARVLLARNKKGELFAMKRIRKDIISMHDVAKNVKMEYDIMLKINHPFLLKIKHFFESEHRLYFFTEFMPGKDLMYQLGQQSQGLRLSEIKFIGAQIILALECLHKNGYLHRDIKNDNVMIDAQGYIRLSDFGLADKLNKKKKDTSVTGSALFMAPEMIMNDSKAIGTQVDWWAVGILLYELHYKSTPFADERLFTARDPQEALKDNI